ncbi:MAG: hypothetical protein EHM40_03470 [Chloroflexi bacterium]|nr:MAG: hypothetical protein EHM40_03470 [Chloroflexota bacterium]
MQSNLSEVERRVTRYWYTDGIVELVGGVMLVLLGIYFTLQGSLARFLGGNSLFGIILQMGFFLLLFLGGGWINQWLVNLLKARLTYPRTGYVEYQTDRGRSSKGKWILFIALSAGIAAFMVLLASLFQAFDAMVALTGLLGAWVFMILRTRSSGLARFYVLAGVSVILGLALSVTGLSISYNAGLFYGLMGICVSISGGWTLRRYLQHNSPPAED